VGSQTISKSTLNDAINAVAADRALLCAASSGSATTYGAGSGTVGSGFAATQLTHLIQERLISQLLTKMGLVVSPTASSFGEGLLTAQLSPQSGSSCTASGAQAVAALTPSYRAVLIATQTDLAVLASHLAGFSLSTAALSTYATANESTTYNDCVSAIFSQNAAKARTALQAIRSGRSFASVAKTDSIDTTTAANGGVIGCAQALDFGPQFTADLEALKIGEVSQPIATTNGEVLLQITSRTAPSSLEALDALEVNVSNAEDALVGHSESTASVTVDPEYGSWRDVSGNFEVVPPAGPAAADLPNSAAVTPPTIALG
jgi:hypothetical protein